MSLATRIAQEFNAIRTALTTSGLTVNGNIGVTGTVDGRDVATDGAKLDGIESGATADQTGAEILSAIEGSTPRFYAVNIGNDTEIYLYESNETNRDFTIRTGASGAYHYHTFGGDGHITGSYTHWDSGNDGAGSGLDADLLDGQQGSYYQQALVSGTNIKTVNGVSVLGSGNISVSSELTDSVSTTSSTVGASATAVKTAYDKATSALQADVYTAGNLNILVPKVKTTSYYFTDEGTIPFLQSDLTITLNSATTLTKCFEAVAGGSGTVTFSFGLTSYSPQLYIYCGSQAQIYVNGVARGTLRVKSKSSLGTTVFTENISVNAGDKIQLYMRNYDYNNSNYKRSQCQDIQIMVGTSSKPIVGATYGD